MPRPKRGKVASTIVPARVASKPSLRKPAGHAAGQTREQASNNPNGRNTKTTKKARTAAASHQSGSTSEDLDLASEALPAKPKEPVPRNHKRATQNIAGGVESEADGGPELRIAEGSGAADMTSKKTRSSRSRIFEVSKDERQPSDHNTESDSPQLSLPTTNITIAKTRRVSRAKIQALGVPMDEGDAPEQHTRAFFHESTTQPLSSPKPPDKTSGTQISTNAATKPTRASRSTVFQAFNTVADQQDDSQRNTTAVIPGTASNIAPSSRSSRHNPGAETPQPVASTDDEDLYGLSPSGEISRAKIEQNKRTSLIQPQSALKAAGTPAIETSILALTKFKRRSRQPSMISLVQQSTDLQDLDDFELDDFGDFDPDNESTPLNLHQSKDLNSSHVGSDGFPQSAARTSSARKRKASDCDRESPDSLPKRPRSSPIRESSPSLPSRRTRSSNANASKSSDSAEPEAPSVTPAQEVESMSSTMAPPLSSPITSSPESSPTKSGRPHRTATTSSQTQRKRMTKIPTERLQSLMPRTRRRPQRKTEPFEISSDNGSDSAIRSELDESTSKSHTRKHSASLGSSKRPTANGSGVSAKPRAKTSKTTAAVQASSTLVPTLTRKTQPAQTSKSGRRTYGRSNDDDKENNEDSYNPDEEESIDVDDTTIRASVDPVWAKKRSKLQAKFAEVDAWEMEFESVDMSQASSPWR